MKRKITLSIALVLSLAILSLMNSDSDAKAQNQLKPIVDTGVITLGPNQELRVTVAAGDVSGDDSIRVRFRQLEYMQTTCSNGVCKNAILGATSTPLLVMAPNESLNVNSGWSTNASGTRIIVLSDNRNVRVNGIVFDTSTQRVVAICCTSTTMYIP